MDTPVRSAYLILVWFKPGPILRGTLHEMFLGIASGSIFHPGSLHMFTHFLGLPNFSENIFGSKFYSSETRRLWAVVVGRFPMGTHHGVSQAGRQHTLWKFQLYCNDSRSCGGMLGTYLAGRPKVIATFRRENHVDVWTKQV